MVYASKLLASVLAVLLLGACAMPEPVDPERSFSITAPRDRSPKADEAANDAVYADLIRGMLNQGQYYAALAHVQEQQRRSGNSDELRYLEAEARRQLGQHAEAEKLYRDLLSGRFDAQGHHGLGLLYAGSDLEKAVLHLRKAVQRRPTDLDARNDLGYALMVGGQYQAALPEIATAVELDANGDKARNNLIILLILMGDDTRLKQVVAQAGTTAATLAQLRKRAQSLKGRKPASRGSK